MKKKVLMIVGVIIVGLIAYTAYLLLTTKSHSPFSEETININGLEISVAYCQPYKKGRLIFGDESEEALIPYGKYWRLGANEATEISFSEDVNFAGNSVSAGTYRMYVVPGKDSWEVSLNSELGKWGAMEPDYDLDVTKVKVETTSTDNVVEQLTIKLASDSTNVLLTFAWDKTKVAIPIVKAN